MALSPNVVVVAPGELITAAHLNNIRSNLVTFDTQIDTAITDINTLQSAVNGNSTAITALDGRIDALEADSGNTNITPSASFTGGTLVFRKIGRLVVLVCNLTKDSNASTNTTFTLGTVPATSRPTATMAFPGVTNAPSGGSCRCTLNATTGVIQAENLTISAGGVLSFTVPWFTA